jgi:hypothetical protein
MTLQAPASKRRNRNQGDLRGAAQQDGKRHCERHHQRRRRRCQVDGKHIRHQVPSGPEQDVPWRRDPSGWRWAYSLGGHVQGAGYRLVGHGPCTMVLPRQLRIKRIL